MDKIELHEQQKMMDNLRNSKPLDRNTRVFYNKSLDVRVYALG